VARKNGSAGGRGGIHGRVGKLATVAKNQTSRRRNGYVGRHGGSGNSNIMVDKAQRRDGALA
jgi:hypothetical protein